MPILATLKQLFASQPASSGVNAIAAGSPTSQKSLTTEFPILFQKDPLLLPRYNLNDYQELFVTDPLAHAIVQALTNLIVSPIRCLSEDDSLCEYVERVIRTIQLESAMQTLVLNAILYGVSYSEIIGDGPDLFSSNRILGLRSIDPRSVIQQIDKFGNVTMFRQRPIFVQSPTPLNLSWDNPLNPDSILVLRNHADTVNSRYGLSVLQPIRDRLAQRSELFTAASNGAKSHSSPVFFLSWQSQKNMTAEERSTNVQLLKQATTEVDANNSRWLHSSGEQGEYQVNTLSASVPPISDITDRLTLDCIVSAGLSPSALGYSVGHTGTTFEDSSNTSINSLCAKQKMVMEQISKLFALLPFIESECPEGEIIVEMEEPSIESESETEATLTTRINNNLLLAKAGLLSPDNCARNLDIRGVYDAERFDEYTQIQMQDGNPNDPNTNQQIQKKLSSNNPSGGSN